MLLVDRDLLDAAARGACRRTANLFSHAASS
jgi:hypothetical protein